MGLGVFCRHGTGLDCTVQFWILQSDADIHFDWIHCDDSIYAEKLVHVLSDGNHDTGDLQVENSVGWIF